MSRFTIRFDEKIAAKLQQNADNKEIAVADYIRSLVDIGLRVEEYSTENNSDKNNEKNREAMYKEAVIAALHTNLLVKNIFLFVCENKSFDEKEKFIEETAKKARQFILEGYPET